MAEYRVTLARVVYVEDRDGPFAAWKDRWCAQGYELVELATTEADSDGRVGRAYLAKGPMLEGRGL